MPVDETLADNPRHHIGVSGADPQAKSFGGNARSWLVDVPVCLLGSAARHALPQPQATRGSE